MKRSATVAPKLLVELAAHPHKGPWDEAQMWAARVPSQGTAPLTGSLTGRHPAQMTTPRFPGSAFWWRWKCHSKELR